ncbi:hypothetical protein GDO81_000978 [Engystomops pustulosus]|uniref:Uncharacterized protein n=1 Tax=Engystomops pustulosus TaxID=76066 RepID=A0AAV7D8U1_ENGPU|nr:hypothetical protein GDO81_000978 [Engystomops pustulosus]
MAPAHHVPHTLFSSGRPQSRSGGPTLRLPPTPGLGRRSERAGSARKAGGGGAPDLQWRRHTTCYARHAAAAVLDPEREARHLTRSQHPAPGHSGARHLQRQILLHWFSSNNGGARSPLQALRLGWGFKWQAPHRPPIAR